MAVYCVHHDQPRFIFIINFKVMYSSLYTILPKYFPSSNFLYKNGFPKINLQHYKLFSIIRNPFHRVVSAYMDKCLKNPTNQLARQEAFLQVCQKQILEALKQIRGKEFPISPSGKTYSNLLHSEERAILDSNFKRLAKIEFEEFTECLMLILKRKDTDGHFTCQADAFQIPGKGLFNFKKQLLSKTKILKLENIQKGWGEICQILGKDMQLTKNNISKRGDKKIDGFYDEKTTRLIADIYKIDFKKFNYPEYFLS